MINVLLVDDHAFIRKSLRYFLEATNDIRVAATASNGVEAVDKAISLCPEIAVIDVSMPIMDGIQTTMLLRLRCPKTRVIMLSIYDNPKYIERALEAGAFGYVLKDMIGEDLLTAIRAVYEGGRFFSQKIAQVARMYIDQKKKD